MEDYRVEVNGKSFILLEENFDICLTLVRYLPSGSNLLRSTAQELIVEVINIDQREKKVVTEIDAKKFLTKTSAIIAGIMLKGKVVI